MPAGSDMGHGQTPSHGSTTGHIDFISGGRGTTTAHTEALWVHSRDALLALQETGLTLQANITLPEELKKETAGRRHSHRRQRGKRGGVRQRLQ